MVLKIETINSQIVLCEFAKANISYKSLNLHLNKMNAWFSAAVSFFFTSCLFFSLCTICCLINWGITGFLYHRYFFIPGGLQSLFLSFWARLFLIFIWLNGWIWPKQSFTGDWCWVYLYLLIWDCSFILNIPTFLLKT